MEQRQASQWDLPHPHVVEQTVTDADIDGLAHANNACYVIWCERCAWDHSHCLGLTVTDYRQLDRGVAIQRADYEYFHPAVSGDRLIIGTWLTACDNKLRLQRQFQIRHAKTGQTVLRGHWRLVCIKFSSGRPCRLPKQFIEIYGAAVVDPAAAPGKKPAPGKATAPNKVLASE